MASSTRSSWTGTLTVGLLAVPISVAPAAVEEKEQSLKDLCDCHKKPIDRSERCSVSGEKPEGKVKGVEDASGKWRVLAASELVAIEDSTKSKTIEIEESRPLDDPDLALAYGMGTYFVRAEKENRAAADSYRVLFEALKKSGKGLIGKWGSRTRERLVVIHADHEKLLMTKIPMVTELRTPGKQELAHQQADVSDKMVDMAVTLIDNYETPEFLHESYVDEGLRLRREAVDKILAGEKVETPEQKKEDVPDIEAMLQASIEAQKEKV